LKSVRTCKAIKQEQNVNLLDCVFNQYV